MSKVMVTIRFDHLPSLDEVIERYGLDPGDVDVDFGVIEIDPADHLVTVRVETVAAHRITATDPGASGPFSDPPIEPFGPPET